RRLLRTARVVREARPPRLHQAAPHPVGRQLVQALWRRDRLLHTRAADHPHVHIAAGRRRADAVLALHGLHAARLHSVGSDAHACPVGLAFRGPSGGRPQGVGGRAAHGRGLALLWLLRDAARAAVRDAAGTTLLTAPAAAIALALEDTIEERVSTPEVAASA